jgi:predicted nucleotidyltransferase
VITEVTDKQQDLVKLCQRFHVSRLDIFGSGSHGNFDPQSSDLDFLVVFELLSPKAHADAYFGLLQELKLLFSRPVDLIELEAINNPYFLEAVEESRSLLYAA